MCWMLCFCVCTYAFSSLQYAKIWRSRMLYKSLKSNDYAVTAVHPVSGWYYFPPREQFCSCSVQSFIIIKVLRRLSGDVLLQGEEGEGLASLCRFRLGPSGLSRGHGLATLLPSSGWLDGPIWLLLSILGSSASLTDLLLLYFFCYWCKKSSHGSIVKSIIKIKKLLYWVSPQAHPASCIQLCPAKVLTERASELG